MTSSPEFFNVAYLKYLFQVWKAEADNICGYEGTILVAVKTAKEDAPQKEVGDLLQEMRIMQQIGPHPNVVTLLGVAVEKGEKNKLYIYVHLDIGNIPWWLVTFWINFIMM